MKKNTKSTSIMTPATPSTKAQKIEILILVVAAVCFALMIMGKAHWIVGLVSAVYIAAVSYTHLTLPTMAVV